ncbi:MAG: hypothetical protein HWN66_03525 [Candidatus Helarchaeota archaeon]|nr:hypothetical protein [Candidatus Helarchaeota archaeon]
MAKDTITVSLGISYAGLMGLTFVSLVIMAGKSSGFGHPDDLGMIVRILFSYIGYGGLLITSLVLILIFINAKEGGTSGKVGFYFGLPSWIVSLFLSIFVINARCSQSCILYGLEEYFLVMNQMGWIPLIASIPLIACGVLLFPRVRKYSKLISSRFSENLRGKFTDADIPAHEIPLLLRNFKAVKRSRYLSRIQRAIIIDTILADAAFRTNFLGDYLTAAKTLLQGYKANWEFVQDQFREADIPANEIPLLIRNLKNLKKFSAYKSKIVMNRIIDLIIANAAFRTNFLSDFRRTGRTFLKDYKNKYHGKVNL